MPTARLPRTVHPAAWWLWALGLAVAASRTTNPLLLALILSVVTAVVTLRRSDAPWAKGLRTYLVLGLVIVSIRVGFRLVLGGGGGSTILFTLPQLSLPELAAGIRIGGPVSLEGLVAAVQDGMRLATLLICVGAANLLADPRRLLKVVPGALYELGTTIVVALTVAPQLIQSVGRVRRARRLRGARAKGLAGLRQSLMPVLEDALDRSIWLAAAMDTRGYGRAAGMAPRTRRLTSGLMLLGMMAVCVGVYGVLDGTAPTLIGLPVLLAGASLGTVGVLASGRGSARTIYRPDPWRGAEWLTGVTGILAAAITILAGEMMPTVIFPAFQPLTWPELPVLAAAGVLAAVMPAVLTPSSPDGVDGQPVDHLNGLPQTEGQGRPPVDQDPPARGRPVDIVVGGPS